MTDLTSISCFLDMAKPTDFFSCFAAVDGVPVISIIYVAFLIFSVVGVSLFIRDFQKSLMIGGFLTTLLGLPFVALNFINVYFWVVSMSVMLLGIILVIIDKNKDD
jgi:hypothetical protein